MPAAKNMALFTLLLVFLAIPCIAQRQYGAGQFPVDSATCKLCDSAAKMYQYYSVGGKYPLSSEALVRKANASVKFPDGFSGTGFVTVRFVVNCKGETNCFHIYQLDGRYKAIIFPPAVSGALQQFVKQLGNWPEAKDFDGNGIDYYAHLTFYIKNGRITQIAP